MDRKFHQNYQRYATVVHIVPHLGLFVFGFSGISLDIKTSPTMP